MDKSPHNLASCDPQRDSYWLLITGRKNDDVREYRFKRSFALIGQADRCDIRLHDPEISYRHAYLQKVESSLACVDVGTRGGFVWKQGGKNADWLTPGCVASLGSYSIQLLGAKSRADEDRVEAAYNHEPCAKDENTRQHLPRAELYVTDANRKRSMYRLGRLITLVGRHRDCHVRLGHKSVSRVHCSLVLTKRGVHVVDLLGRGGTLVNGEPIQEAFLAHGDELRVGEYRLEVRLQEFRHSVQTIDHQPQPTAEDVQSTSDTNVGQESGTVPATNRATSTESAAHVLGDPVNTTWMGKLFAVDQFGTTLIVTPLVTGGSFAYSDLHVEYNALLHKLDRRDVENLILDLQHVAYFGSQLTDVFVALARKITNQHGKAVLVKPSEPMMRFLSSMRIDRVWPIANSHEEALAIISSRGAFPT
jgi:anti-anti-sigma factor